MKVFKTSELSGTKRGHNFLAPIPIKKILPEKLLFLGRILDLKKTFGIWLPRPP